MTVSRLPWTGSASQERVEVGSRARHPQTACPDSPKPARWIVNGNKPGELIPPRLLHPAQLVRPLLPHRDAAATQLRVEKQKLFLGTEMVATPWAVTKSTGTQ